MSSLKWKKGGATAPQGFLASGSYCGIKKKRTEDLALIYSEAPCVAAGTFTLNRLVAWPVLWSRNSVKFPYHHAVLASSGNANCFNGPTGEKAIEVSLRKLSKALDIPKESILIAQTGVIGVPFPIKKMEKGISTLYQKLSLKGQGAARGILTTDTRAKECALSFKCKGKEIKVGSIAKGAGMIHPDMATMLVFITTDLNISKPLLNRLLKKAVNETFNQMSIDNDLSTNDCVLVLANGLAGNKRITQESEAKGFYEAMLTICKKQRFEMVRDGEGITKVCTIKIQNAKTAREGGAVARQIANSMLFKTMLAGSDPNWGRVAAAIGSTGIPVDFKKIKISFNGVSLLKNGAPQSANLGKAKKILKKNIFQLEVDLKRGAEEIDFVTSDLTKKYVEINSEYTT